MNTARVPDKRDVIIAPSHATRRVFEPSPESTIQPGRVTVVSLRELRSPDAECLYYTGMETPGNAILLSGVFLRTGSRHKGLTHWCK